MLMQQPFTPDHLIRYIYKETSAAETLAIDAALQRDDKLWATYETLRQGYRQLPKAKFSPSPKAIKNILAYSERTEVEREV